MIHKNIYTKLEKSVYTKLEKLGVVALIEHKIPNAKSVALPFMTLHFDLYGEADGEITIALAHYSIKGDDLCADPDMQIRVIPAKRLAEALTYKQTIPEIYNEVYPEPGKVQISVKRQLNGFLDEWLGNLIAQGHRFHVTQR